MAVLGAQKAMLLNQVKNQPGFTVEKLKSFVDKFEDVKPEDFAPVIDSNMLQQLIDACRDPHELALWQSINDAPRLNSSAIQEVQKLVAAYIQQYPGGPKIEQVKALDAELAIQLDKAIENERLQAEAEIRRKQAEEMAKKEQADWDVVDKNNYQALLAYRVKYPMSAHLDEIDDFMWAITAGELNGMTLTRYLNDWPNGRNAAKARSAMTEAQDWEKVRNTEDLEKINKFRYEHPGSQFSEEAERTFTKLRSKKLAQMQISPTSFSKEEALNLVNSGIFTKNELINAGVVSEKSWEAMHLNRSTFPDIQQLMANIPEITAQKDCTDIYLFGTPGTGKTCLLMGLAHADGTQDEKGQAYTLNMKINGGKYASALQQYVKAGLTPGRTSGNYISTIHANVSEKDKKGRFIDHPINFVEMSGEEFAIRISDGDAVAFEDMGTGATQLLRNDNRKVFFIIVDSGDDKVPFSYEKKIKDINGNVVGQEIVNTFISQLDILNKFMGLIDQKENKAIMDKVDAIHFVVTKADRLGNHVERKERARELLLDKYSGPVERLKLYCRNSKRINATSNFKPQVFTFSLGNFYVGDVFAFDNTETLEIVDAIRTMTTAKREEGFVDKLRKILG